jgi:hypothetical protein
MTPNRGFIYLLEQLPTVGKFVVAQMVDNNKSLSFTIFSDTFMTSTKSLSFVWCFIRGLLKIPSISALLTDTILLHILQTFSIPLYGLDKIFTNQSLQGGGSIIIFSASRNESFITLFIQAYNMAILPHHRDNYLCDCPFYVRSRTSLCNQAA